MVKVCGPVGPWASLVCGRGRKKISGLGNVMVMIPYMLQKYRLLTLEVANRDTETSEITLYLSINTYVL